MPVFQIRNLRRSDDGHGRVFWTAVLVSGSTRIHVSKRFGSWRVVHPDGTLSELIHPWPERLQGKVRPIERKEQKVTCPA
jgi:hypothetical protein